jgi:hypothetical protein
MQKSNNITITKAYYGSYDVKDIIEKKYLKNNIMQFSVSNDIFGDPSPGAGKLMDIEIEHENQLKSYVLYEGQIFKYPEEDQEIQRKTQLMLLNREELIKSLNLNGLGIEIGVQGGYYSEVILRNSNLHMILLDSWRHIENGYFEGGNTNTENHIELLNNVLKLLINKYENRFTLIRELSENIVSLFKDQIFDFIYLDADHSEKFVKNELVRWWPKLKYGGIIAGHDYVSRGESFGVKEAVDSFFASKSVNIDICDTGCCPTWLVKKI